MKEYQRIIGSSVPTLTRQGKLLVVDGGRLPRSLKYYLQVLSEGVTNLYCVPRLRCAGGSATIVNEGQSAGTQYCLKTRKHAGGPLLL